MKEHIVTFILLLIATFAFVLRFYVAEEWIDYCDIAAFALPTLAAFIEIHFSEKNRKVTEKQIADLKEKAENAVYAGEPIGYVPDIDTTRLKEEYKKQYPDLNP